MKAPANAAPLPLTFKIVKRQRGKSLVGASAAAALANEQVAILHPDILGQPVGAGDWPDGTVGERFPAHGSAGPLLNTTGLPCGVWRYASTHAFFRSSISSRPDRPFSATSRSSAASQCS